jgi:ABC-2 type transport system permease protein
MNTLFAPKPGAAPLGQQIRAHAALETQLLLRNGEQLLLGIGIPLLALLGGTFFLSRFSNELTGEVLDLPAASTALVPGVMALAIMSTSFTAVAISTGFERRYGVLKWLGATPLPRVGLLAGKVLALILVECVQLGVLAGAAMAMGWRPTGLLVIPLSMLGGTAAFVGLALAIAGSLRPEGTLAVSNLAYVVLAAVGGVVLPAPGGWGEIAHFLPSGALGDLLRSGLAGDAVPTLPTVVLGVWAVIGALMTHKFFCWE